MEYASPGLIDFFDFNYEDGEEFTVVTGKDTMFGRIWAPEHEPKYIYVYVHGLAVFITANKDIFKVINKFRGVVFACDHKGHGRSPGERAATTIQDIIAETAAVIELAKENYPDLPVFVHGHSMGGLAVMSGIISGVFTATGAIVEAPYLSPVTHFSIIEVVAMHLLNNFWPKKAIDTGAKNPEKQLHPLWVQRMKKEPMNFEKITPMLFCSIQEAQVYVRTNLLNWPEDCPILFLQGYKDKFSDPIENKIIADALYETEIPIETYFFPEGDHLMTKTRLRKDILMDIISFIDEIVTEEVDGEEEEEEEETAKDDSE